MTIARRILLLAAATPLVLVALGVFTQVERAAIESRSRFVVETQVPSLSALGHVSRTFEEMRVTLRDHLLAEDAGARSREREVFAADQAELDRLLRHYADTLVSDDRDRRLLDEFRDLARDWNSAAAQIMALTDGGQRAEAARRLAGDAVVGLGVRTSQALSAWIAHNDDLAARAGEATLADLEQARRRTWLALALAIAL